MASKRAIEEQPQLKKVQIRPIKSIDLDEIEQLIKDTILKTNAKDYLKPVIDFMLGVDPFRPRETRHERDYFVAVDDQICGIIGLKDNEVKTFFVDSAHYGKGIGTALLAHVEKLISDRGYPISKVFSSVSARGYYEKQGYRFISEDSSKAGEEIMLRYYMEKVLKKVRQI
ncbi:MAG: GNAT family N-acetyltransferase [Candidatus Moraniibacteriota bacterium]